MAEISARQTSPESYDAVPYDSRPYAQTNPLVLQGIARLFGLRTPAPGGARILEIGCSSGGNIIPIAACYPKSQCTGIDYSPRQIEAAKEDAKALGLSNLDLQCLPVMDVTKALGEFDYIICHGILSWVSPEMQEAIFRICKNNLARGGIAYISYNTLPGWNSVKSVRDLMLFHTERYADPIAKAKAAREILAFMGDAMKECKNPMLDSFNREATLINAQGDTYLLHDHLEANNIPFYFYEFMERAQVHGLQYVADTSVEHMFSGNFSPATAAVIAASENIIRSEQYMDFIYNRRFRNTLLTHDDQPVDHKVQSGVLHEGFILSRFTCPPNFGDHDITRGQMLSFQTAGGVMISSAAPAALAMLQCLREQNGKALRISELAMLVKAKLESVRQAVPSDLENMIVTYVLRYIFAGGIVFLLEPLPFTATPAEKPKLFPLAQLQAKRQPWVTNRRQEVITLSAFDKAFMPYVDGTRDQPALVEQLLPHFLAKKMVLNENKIPVTDEASLRQKIPPCVSQVLLYYTQQALLEG